MIESSKCSAPASHLTPRASKWTISDLARKIGSQPSPVSRWMMGQRPNTESIRLIAEALGLDELYLMQLTGHITPELAGDGDPRVLNLKK